MKLGSMILSNVKIVREISNLNFVDFSILIMYPTYHFSYTIRL